MFLNQTLLQSALEYTTASLPKTHTHTQTHTHIHLSRSIRPYQPTNVASSFASSEKTLPYTVVQRGWAVDR